MAKKLTKKLVSQLLGLDRQLNKFHKKMKRWFREHGGIQDYSEKEVRQAIIFQYHLQRMRFT